MEFLVSILIFIFGLIVGSFLNAVIYRLYKNKTLMGFSACPRCSHRLFPKDLLPLFSFLWLGGRCRYCKKKISWQYPLVELGTATIFTILARQILFLGGSLDLSASNLLGLGFGLIFVSVLIIIFVFDFRYYLIPDIAIILGTILAMVYRLTIPEISLKSGLYGMLVLVGFFGILFLVSQGRWIGFGDVKLGVFLGLMLGFSLSVLMLGMAYVGGAVVAVVLVLFKKKTMKGVLPFGTFLTASTVAVFLWGEQILNWYLAYF
ncbi:MAG: prepilin peptidase [Candidatus Doudnabacteria bacterium CG10_big_fil_rev_8_21_14_0_10_41_10]|uniref:Prepilin peptidase n=1 Tax=Candidatus Doudnabacteria bacterium CG10_big_fil_rev_8_21_14_0_10_41_10 TaxID=1974551 RepID=A0A2H0VH48_9BACT|nr:MAG: prepilin peptidase [Candidatus Doudnabacteria bacterium CG10_big_fil_rev_8_21_14_0_10_41_10]